MTQRLVYRRRLSYRTTSNATKVVKTPGGNLVYQYIGKKGKVPSCGECGVKLFGIPALRPHQYKNIPKCRRTVARAYGGSKCATCVRTRIVRAFLIEEQKTAKLVYRKKQRKEKKSSK
ncbi:S60 ribosomal protein L34 [Tieghemostelium lacteum]|uniref:S60 ribosomal protein L34 n=1 Tax=Tieghemostelium lacteum TaxID=361077 RepID=A0A151Z674_TIELA|nr:S60 ribosomal protein L34 [Tieghemostelium lacteum]|eukprot:KYQ89445.1 S60 ribosomal protein L34 [Tieghemostelium lacteum]